MPPKWNVRHEPTPNPQSLKFLAGAPIATGSAEFLTAKDSLRSPLARKIFGFPWTQSVFVGTDFVTVTKQEWVDWETLAEPLAGLIAEHLERGEPVLLEARDNPPREGEPSGTVDPSDSPDVQRIKAILEQEIRPAVAMDGGDVEFDRFDEGVVYLRLKGSCSGCPSSEMTLRDGIEGRLRAAVPAVMGVVGV